MESSHFLTSNILQSYSNWKSMVLAFKKTPNRGSAILVVKNLSSNAEDMGSIPDPGRSHMPQSN